MCGIFGYVGAKNNAALMTLEGLKLLEYRGYDSWGIAVKTKGKLVVDKHTGKIGEAKTVLPQSTIGIGHTRWATHGGVTVKNAHPHMDCTREIAVIHNGIIENFLPLKKDLEKKGHVFISETDTEVFAHLVEEYRKTEPFSKSVRKAFNKIKGLNGIVALDASADEIIAAKTGSPLIVGKGQDGYYIASDSSGILPHTKELLFLKDNEMVILGKTFTLLSLPNGDRLTPEFVKVDWKIQDSTKGAHKHFMIKEISEQPKVVRNIAENYHDQIENLARVISIAKGTFFIGSGTAFHACLVGTYLFSKIVKKHVNTAVASEFNYLEHFLNNRSLVIALSQSGETIDVVEPLVRAKQKRSKVFAITNVLGSTIYRLADYKMLLGAGPEKAVASTKAYIAKISLLLLLSYAMIGEYKKGKEMLLLAADEIERLLREEYIREFKKIATVLNKTEHIYTIGRGFSYPTCLEAALKIKEVSYVHTEGLAGGELKHGTLALISPGTPCIVFAPQDETYEAIISNATEIKARGGVIIGVSPFRSEIFDYWIEVKDIGDATLIPMAIPAQLLGYFLAVKKDLDPDKPRNLAKSVTVK
ncbi:MAG: glutamine--fructose-6-phosphate transaminase (isomerizing) [Candidatus Levybacteria bacterium]|nr:glutamine--fructose-6-phosphate transaminase (isomerizing) [Candidatus Levybacteria bacterium]